MTDLALIAQLIVNGLMAGGTYAILAIGLSLIFGVMNVLNVSYGALYALGGYFGYTFSVLLGQPPLASLFLAMIASFGIGVLIERFAIERVKGNVNSVILLTFGLAILIEQLITLIYSGSYQAVPGIIQGAIVIGGITVNLPRFMAFVVSVALSLLLIVFVYRTKIGSAIRVVAFDQELALLRGISVRRISMLTLGISSMLAATAAALLAPLLSLYPAVGWNPLLIAFVVVVLGGMGSLGGTVIAGVIYGLVDVFTGFYLGSEWRQITVLLVIVAVLLLRPQGILGKVVERV